MAKKMTAGSIAGLNRALRALPKSASVELKDASYEITEDVAEWARSRAVAIGGPYAKYVAPTIKPRRDRVPRISIGSKRRIPGRSRRAHSDRQRIGELMWGVEFGGKGRRTTQQFHPHLGTTGYALWPTIRENFGDIVDRWADALYDATVESMRKAA